MSKDTVYRQDAIDALGERPMVWTDDDQYALGERSQYDRDRLAIEALPAALPERKRGKWISDEDGNIYCSVCGRTGVGESFCEHCGANMKGEEE